MHTIASILLLYNVPLFPSVLAFALSRCRFHRSMPFDRYRPCFVFRHPTGLVRNVFLQPFTDYVWYSLIAAGIVIICVTCLISYLEELNTGKLLHPFYFWFDFRFQLHHPFHSNHVLPSLFFLSRVCVKCLARNRLIRDPGCIGCPSICQHIHQDASK